MRKLLVVYPNRDYGKLMWEDLKKDPHVDFIESPLNTKNRFYKQLFRFHYSFRINQKMELPGKQLWDAHYSLAHYDFDDNIDYIILFTDVSLCNYRREFLEKLKKRGNIKFALVLINSFYRMRKIIEPMLGCFNLVYTYDKKEAALFGFKYYPTVYSMVSRTEKEVAPRTCFFVGVAKDRLNKLIAVYDQLEKRGLNPEFYISGVARNKQISRSRIIYNKWLPYKIALKKTLQSSCVVEIMDKNNAGVTLRTLEAICYNKRLITNNKKIIDSPFYKSAYIHLIDQRNVNSGDFWNFQKPVEYGYDGRYSPLVFLNRLDKDI